ncbi:MAG: DUF933 domain-containing protein [Candidatus Latescibacterota bacterium]|nr:DUF933 domain-containing protein [Candidatus Latescibacterota bacterium]
MKLGLVGYPKVGKHTMFSLLTGQPTDEISNQFQGLAKVRDPRFDLLCDMYNPAKETPAVIEFELLPDLDENAERNAEALKALENVDAICHVIRSFEDESVYHISGTVDASRDIGRFAEELQFNDLFFIDKRLERLKRENKNKKDDEVKTEQLLLTKMKSYLEDTGSLSTFEFSEQDESLLASYPLLTRKTVINVVNTDENNINSSIIKTLMEDYSDPTYSWVNVSAQIEDELMQLEEPERPAFLQDLGLSEPAIDRLTQICYESLGLLSFFTVGTDEVRAWTIRKNSNAPQAGRAIHSDIERGFIRAEIMAYSDLIEHGNEEKLKAAGKFMQKGRDYVVQDGDIIHFLHKT